MAYSTTSIKEIIARIIRNLDNKFPSYYVDSFLEWIPEALEELRTPFTLDIKSSPNVNCDNEIRTKNHVAKLPCGLVEIISIEDEFGYRLHRSGVELDITNPSIFKESLGEDDPLVTNFLTNVRTIGAIDPGTGTPLLPSVPWDGRNLTPVTSPTTAPYYNLKLDYIQTSCESMFVKIHYNAYPVDHEGYPLIPNQVEFKEALYWYVMKKLIGTGFQHPVIPTNLNGLDYCDRQYKEYAGRSLGEIKMPDMDRMSKLYNSTVRLIPPVMFHDDFFVGDSEIQPVRYV